MELKSVTLLRRAAVLLTASDVARRDVLLEVGGLLHDHVLARLEEGRELPNYKTRPTREVAVKEAAAALGMKVCRVHDLLHVAMVRRLLFAGVDLGSASWSVVRLFKPLVQRCRLTRSQTAQSPGDDRTDPSARETWTVVGGTPHPARRALAHVLSQGLGWQAALAYLRTVRLTGTAGERLEDLPDDDTADREARPTATPYLGKPPATRGPNRPEQSYAMVHADPRDVADHLAKLITQHRHPDEVIERLLGHDTLRKLWPQGVA